MTDSVIKVRSSIIPEEFNSLDAAASAATNQENKDKMNLINGKVVKDYTFNEKMLVIGFDNGKYLTIAIDDNQLKWDVVTDKPDIASKYFFQDPIFEFEGGEKIAWNLEAVMASFKGQQVAISSDDRCFFIFARDGNEYLIDVLVDQDNPDNQFLFMSEI